MFCIAVNKDFPSESPEWSQWSVCLCNHDVVLLNISRGIQHRTLERKDGVQAEYRTCPCEGNNSLWGRGGGGQDK